MSTKAIKGSTRYQPLTSCLRRKAWLVKCQVSSPRRWFGVPTEREQGFQKGEAVSVQSSSVISLSFLYYIFADFDRICLLHRQKEAWRALYNTQYAIYNIFMNNISHKCTYCKLICSTASHSEYFGNSK